MRVYIGLFRAVNVGSGTQVRMEALRTLLENYGLEDVRTLLQSGNIVFRSAATDGSVLERPLGEKVARAFGVKTELFVRSAREWRSIAAANPFPREAVDDPGHLLLTVLRSSPSNAQWMALASAIRGRERVRGSDRCAYVVYPDGVGRSKLTNALIESKLGTASTARNWNTVLKLAALAVELEGSAAPSP